MYLEMQSNMLLGQDFWGETPWIFPLISQLLQHHIVWGLSKVYLVSTSLITNLKVKIPKSTYLHQHFKCKPNMWKRHQLITSHGNPPSHEDQMAKQSNPFDDNESWMTLRFGIYIWLESYQWCFYSYVVQHICRQNYNINKSATCSTLTHTGGGNQWTTSTNMGHF